jgi:agmatine deiminase
VKYTTFIATLFLYSLLLSACARAKERFVAPGEFELQEYIWLTWYDDGWFGGEPFSTTALALMKEITPHVKVRLLYGEDYAVENAPREEKEVLRNRIVERLYQERIETSRVELFYYPKPMGSIQDPGPFFLVSDKGRLAVADYEYNVTPDRRAEALDRYVAEQLGLAVVESDLVSEGGSRQSNGKGTLLLVESVELDRNPGVIRDHIEAEHKRVLGATKVVWLKQGLKEEQSGKLENGIWGIGTDGHIDTFCRFAGPNTILLAEVSEEERDDDPLLRESYERMEENYRILRNSTDQDGNPFEISRVPVAELMTKTIKYDSLRRAEKSWFKGARPGEEITFYLAAGYMSFIIVNDVVVTSKYWKEGRPESMRRKDQQARDALQRAFPDRRIVQVDAMPIHHDGAGLHCHSRNQPAVRLKGG